MYHKNYDIDLNLTANNARPPVGIIKSPAVLVALDVQNYDLL